ncbi:MAG: translocation/assembly module TamB, partial [Fibromonadaceae bacterium]|nr:translocation/assembly module TamB [Fibromonadaceae bacterium]
KDLSFNTEQFTLSLLDEHWIKIRNGSGKTKLDTSGITILAELPSISYRMESSEYGTAIANLKGQAAYRFPFQTGQSQTNPSITGNFEISKTSYKKMLDIMPDPLHLDRTLKSISRFLTSLTKEKRVNTTEKQAMTSRPTTLNIKVQTSGMETATVSSNLAEFAFVVNMSVLGTTRNILLSGDVNAVGNGKIGYNGLTMFDLSFLRIYWRDTPIKQGIIELRAANDYPRCFRDENSKEETCTVFVNVTGPISQLNMQPSTSCSNVEASPALIYYSMLLGCISENYENGANIDYNRLLGKAISYTINRNFGGNVIGDIDFKWQVFNNEDPTGQDTNYVRIPVSLSRWVPNLEAIFGYTSDQSNDPRYDESYEIGLRYTLPIFDSTDISWNLIDPSLDISTGLVARKYHSPIDGGSHDEARLEKNIGLVYRHKFWNQCILGLGNCKISETSNGKNNAKSKERQTE